MMSELTMDSTLTIKNSLQPIEILLVEDDDGDALLTTRALQRAKIANSVHIAVDGVDALAFLRREGEYADAPRPNVVLLDLNLPKMDGRELLAEIKRDEDLRSIPVVVLTTSDSERDILSSYDLQASAYITKPVDLAQFSKMVSSISEFWFTVVKLPRWPRTR